MPLSIRAHFDGKVFIPDESVDLPSGQRVLVEAAVPPAHNGEQPTREAIEERLRRLRRFAGSVSAPVLPDEAVRREGMYEGRP